MTFKKLTYASLATCFLSFLSLLLCVFLSPVDAKIKEWIVASIFSFFGALISARMLRQKQAHIHEEDRTPVGESTFESTLVAMILWFPVLLTMYAISGMLLLHVRFEKVGWVLVVLAVNTGFQTARLKPFS